MTGYPEVLLVDGMGLLVRADRAAQHMSPLSFNGRDTRTLVAFTGSLIRNLRTNPWSHVLVAWEGQPSLNWRKQFWPEYKSNRLRHHDDAPVMSIAEELAQDFIEAAGIFQVWESAMEGDDIIAAAWRQFRRTGQGAQITILSSDRDLLQLAEPGTVCRAGPDDLTEREVFLEWGVPPARLPLLRALAGDPSDGIPGVLNVGPAKAARMMADTTQSDLALIHSLAVPLGIEKQAQVYAWWVISNLREPVLKPQLDLGEDCGQAAWDPASYSDSMRAFLEQWGMERLRKRLDAGDLPWPASSPEK